MEQTYRYFNRDLSWLGFNKRVLLEAQNPEVPLYERIRFLSIFSSNLDEFFRVRYPALKALRAGESAGNAAPGDDILQQVQQMITELQEQFGTIFRNHILPGLQQNGIHLYYGEPLHPGHLEASRDFFNTDLLTFLRPVLLEEAQRDRVQLRNNQLYFLVQLERPERPPSYALLNIPADDVPRFITLPPIDGVKQIAFIDDIIRQHIGRVFPAYEVTGCYSIKTTLNADINLADEWSHSFEDQVAHMIEQRENSTPTRLLFDAAMPADARSFLREFFRLTPKEIIEGGRYHNFKDFADLPNPAGAALTYPSKPPRRHSVLAESESVFDAIRQRDEVVHLPYQHYSPILRFFNEAAIDPSVEEIYVTLYRVAARSHIVNALISAARNGKSVTAFVELKARFDEANNLAWAKKMKAAGVNIVYSIPEMKVHSKLALVKRRVGWSCEYFGLLGTGNFNESTARFYTDHLLLTAHRDLTREMNLMFAYLLSRSQPEEYQFMNFNHLMVARFNLAVRLKALVAREIANKAAGKPARITIKINNLQEREFIDLFYDASNAGVQIELIVRGICCLVPGVPGMSEHITVRRIVDRYLEHARVFIFHNDGNPEVYLGSSDLMERNLRRRIEVIFPVYDDRLKQQLQEIVAIQLRDNTQAVALDSAGEMIAPEPGTGGGRVQAQDAIYEYLGSA